MITRLLAKIRPLALLACMLCAPPASAIDLLIESRVDTALAAGTPEVAIAELEAAAAQPDDPEFIAALLTRLADLYADLGRHAEAARTYERLAERVADWLGPTAPELASIWERAGRAYEAAGQPTPAITAYIAAVRIDTASGHDPVGGFSDLALDRLLADLSARERRSFDDLRKEAVRFDAAIGGGDPESPDATTGYSLVKIYYATNRARTDAERPADIFGAARSEVSYGTAEVSIPQTHTPGMLEAPSVFSFDITEDPNRHVLLTSVSPGEKGEVFAQMRGQLTTQASNEAFVFIHGFNVSFADGARRTAQMAHDMNFKGLPILFSWPSQGSLLGYLADGAVVQLSGRYLSTFLEDVVAESGATRIHLIAHSMGNRALTEALELFALRHAGQPPAFDQVLFTAPDLDAGLFAAMVETMRPAVGRMTLYTSKNDWALRVSHQLNGGAPRAGEGVAGTIVPELVDSIDMSVLGGDMVAHNYFADDALALTDILSLFWRDVPPPRRCGMAPSAIATTSAEWSLEPDRCDGQAMLTALRLLRAEDIGNLSDALDVIATRYAEETPERRVAIETALRALFAR